MAISKRLRYEILRRDNHTCRYCGATAPDAKMTVDHVVPVALGGTDAPENLVAACEPCNSGKSSVPASAELVSQVSEDAARWAAAIAAAASRTDDQLREVTRWFKPLWYERASTHGRKRRIRVSPEFITDSDDVDYLGRVLITDAPRPRDWIETVSKFLSLGLPKSVIEGHVERTMARNLPSDALWPYFCGCCWNSVRDLQEEARKILEEEEGRL